MLVAHLYFRTFCATLDVSGTTCGARSSHAIGQIGLMLKFICIYLWCSLSALVNFDGALKHAAHAMYTLTHFQLRWGPRAHSLDSAFWAVAKADLISIYARLICQRKHLK
jgi:hypothetical protein